MLESRHRIRFYWVHSCWLLFIFLLHVNSWFTLWAYRDLGSWTIAQLLLLITVPVLLYLASHVSVPEIPEHEVNRHDMRLYFYARHRLLLGLLAASVICNLACEYLLLGGNVLSLVNWLRLLAIALLVLGSVFDRPALHVAIALALLAMFGVGLAFLGAPIAN
jgi:hypothetical protein